MLFLPRYAIALSIIALLGACTLFKKDNKGAIQDKKLESPTVTQEKTEVKETALKTPDLKALCLSDLTKLPGEYSQEKLEKICLEVQQIPECKSVNNIPIYHYDKAGENSSSIKVLVFALIHGDEPQGGSVTRKWMERLSDLTPRNAWRIVPVLNPDGLRRKTRTNAHGIDLNRNFPSLNWEKEALNHWVKGTKKDKRKFPGKIAASEPETLCAMKHIELYQPDLIIAVHTPLGMLDFDGPKVKYPKGASLPWMKLGHYPGSLGRYMWRDNKTPVLTIELKGPDFLNDIGKIDKLQDISGLLAIMASKEIERSKSPLED